MTKNLSNPLNARKVAQILADDCLSLGYSIQERDISVFLSDHRISDLQTALKQLKQEGILPSEYNVSDSGKGKLVAEDFLSTTDSLKSLDHTASEDGLDLLDGSNYNSIEFKTQIESLKTKLIKSWSGGISIDGNELDNFDRKFGRPMNYFKEQMQSNVGEITDLQAFAVVYATDHLSLGDNSKDEVYHLMFDRFDQIKTELREEFGFQYSWPTLSGTSFIEMGKKFSIGPELAEFAKKFRAISGLDTYPDTVIQVFFFQLITGPLLEEMIEKNLLFRWSDDTTSIAEPLRWLLPPSEYNIDLQLRELLMHGVISHTLLTKIEVEPPSLLEILREIEKMDRSSRSAYLAKKIEAALTRKSVAIQFGTTLANFFENFKTNPAKVTPFLDTTLRYYSKTEHVTTLLATIEHSIRTALKNSTGIIKEYLRNISDEELVTTIKENLEQSLNYTILSQIDDNSSLIGDGAMDQLELKLRSMEDQELCTFFENVFDQLFQLTNNFAKSLEPQKIEPKSSEGGLSELTHDFISTIKYHGSKDYQTKPMIDRMIGSGLSNSIAEIIAHACSYMTYQVASKEGANGAKMISSLIENYESKAKALAAFQFGTGEQFSNQSNYESFIIEDLTQSHALVALASQIKTNAYNAWTPLQTSRAKATLFFNEVILPNLLYWQRQPRSFIIDLFERQLINKSAIKELVAASNRLSMVEAYSLLCMGTKSDINSFTEARQYLAQLFSNDQPIDEAFSLNSRFGEAEIALEAILLWSNLQEVAQ